MLKPIHANRVQATEALPRAGSSGMTTLIATDPSVNYYRGTWTASGANKQSLDSSAALQVAFFGTQATLTMGTGTDYSVFDIYVDGDLWSTADGYATATGSQTFTITLPGDGPHVLEVRNRPDHNIGNVTNPTVYRLLFQTLAITGQPADVRTTAYVYDRVSRLTAATSYAGMNLMGSPLLTYCYSYDLAGNRLTATAAGTTTTNTYNNLNQIATVKVGAGSPVTYTYDASGRLTNDGTATYTWDSANRLLSVGTTSYLYNGLGQRMQQTVGSTITQYLLDTQPGLAKVLQATTGSNVTRYLHGLMGIQAQQNPDTTWTYPIQDGLGSVRGTVNSTNVPQESRFYDPYGTQTQASGTSQTVFGFTGEETDSNGLVNLRARYYNPGLGQFFSLDPLEGSAVQPLSLGRYIYAQNNVINAIDPSGMYVSPYPAQGDTCNAKLGKLCPSTSAPDYSLFPQWGAILTVDGSLQGTKRVLLQGQEAEQICWKDEHKEYLAAAFAKIDKSFAAAQVGWSYNQVFGAIEFRFVPTSTASAGLTPIEYHGNLIQLGINLISNPNGSAPRRKAGDGGIGDPGNLYGFSIVPVQADVDNPKNFIVHTIVHELGHAFDYRTQRSLFTYGNDYNLPAITTSSSIAKFCEHCDGDMTETVADYFLNWVYQSYIGVDLNDFSRNNSSNSKRISAYWLGNIAFDEPFQPNNPRHRPATPGVKGWAMMAATF